MFSFSFNVLQVDLLLFKFSGKNYSFASFSATPEVTKPFKEGRSFQIRYTSTEVCGENDTYKSSITFDCAITLVSTNFKINMHVV